MTTDDPASFGAINSKRKNRQREVFGTPSAEVEDLTAIADEMTVRLDRIADHLAKLRQYALGNTSDPFPDRKGARK
jgi:hypothetical protein